MNDAQQDAIFVRNFSIVLLALTAIGIGAYVLASIIYADFLEDQQTDTVVSDRTAPVGQVNTTGESITVAAADTGASDAGGHSDAGGEAEAAGAMSGDAVYKKVCFACHDAGIGGAPKMGDAGQWSPRFEKGLDMMVSNAVNGYTGEAGIMPAKGGLTSLSDDEVRAAVIHMANASGGSFEAAAAPAPAPAPEPEPQAAAEPAPMPAEEAAPAEEAEAAPPPAVADGRGKEVYDTACFICHTPGAAGAPRFGDAAGWASRLEKGMDTLYDHAVKGFMGEAGLMPPKGGRPDLSDDDVKAAVDYMVAGSK